MENEEFTFRLRKVFSQCAVNKGLNISPERYQARVIDEGAGKYLAEGILLLATKEDEVFDYPVNWLTKLGQKWQNLKAKMPRRIRKWFPLEHTRIWAVSKFPDLNVPASFFGSEFIHFKVANEVEGLLKNPPKRPQNSREGG